MSTRLRALRPDVRRRVLVIDGDDSVATAVARLGRTAGFEVVHAQDGERGLAFAMEQAPDVILLDLALAGRDGIDVLPDLRAEPALASVPIVVVSGRSSRAAQAAAFRAGADDFIAKPFHAGDLDARVRANLRKRELYLRLERAHGELRAANERLLALSGTDELTALANRRALSSRLAEEFARAERYETPLSVVAADLDGFKQVNDTYGHAVGDRVLAQLSRRLRALARATDLVARLGGDEFAFVLPHTGLAEARAFAERLLARFDVVPLRLPDGDVVAVRLSCGVATLPDSGPVESPAALLEAADRALYEAKRAGGGRAICARPEPMPRERAVRLEPPDRLTDPYPPRREGGMGAHPD
jgi:diguanylate cyclase (GGDEF)-like protein